uniref:Progesterone-induced-blocking factor 1 n=1 Tax=Strigamia maritima TaxID=126957 RepID=T1IU59_STRMM
MATERNSKSINESEDPSLETTIPTDFTLSPESDEGKHSKLTLKQQLERKQLLHDLQLLKIELSHKSNIIDNMKAEYMTKVDDLEEKMADVQHQKQVIQARLEAQLKLHEEESKRRLMQNRKEMEIILRKQEDLEETNARLQERAGDIKRTLRELELSEDQYYQLKTLTPDLLSLKDYIAMRIYEICWPLKEENIELRNRENKQKEMLHNIHTEYSMIKDDFETTQQKNSDLQSRNQRLEIELTELRSLTTDCDYKRDNFDRIKTEKERFESEVQSLRRNCSTLQTENNCLNKEKVDIFSELKSLRQKVPLLKQDKDYFSKQFVELTSKLNYAEERLSSVSGQLERCQEAREDVYERFVSARDKYKNEYDQRLNEEIEKIQEKTDRELEKLKTSQTEVRETEIKALRDSRDNALSQRDKSDEKLRETQRKYDELRMEVKQLQSNDTARVSELRSELKLKTLDLERTQMIELEFTRNFKNLQIENEKLMKKVEIVTNELYEQQSTSQVRIAELELSLSDRSGRLAAYEKLENELDDIVIQAAEAGDNDEAERIMFSFGYGANVPTTAKRRLQQSVQLARRILNLEKVNTDLSRTLENEKKKCDLLAEELANSKEILDQAQQPYGYMIGKMRVRDEQLQQTGERLKTLEVELK